MLESFKRVSNPLTIIAIFAGITEVGGTVVLPFLSDENQSVYLWFLIAFPGVLVVLFFITLNFNNKVLYAPSDFEDENHFIGLVSKQVQEMEVRLEKTVSKEIAEKVSDIEVSVSHQELLSRGKKYLEEGKLDEALDEVDQAIEAKDSAQALCLKAMIFSRKEKYEQAIEYCSKGLEFDVTATLRGTLLWNRACYKSLAMHEPNSIVDDLKNAILYRIDLAEKLETDSDLEYIRGTQEFDDLIHGRV